MRLHRSTISYNPHRLCEIKRTMDMDLGDLNAFVAVARAKGFRDGARASGGSASGLSEAVRRLETQLWVSGCSTAPPAASSRPRRGSAYSIGWARH